MGARADHGAASGIGRAAPSHCRDWRFGALIDIDAVPEDTVGNVKAGDSAPVVFVASHRPPGCERAVEDAAASLGQASTRRTTTTECRDPMFPWMSPRRSPHARPPGRPLSASAVQAAGDPCMRSRRVGRQCQQVLEAQGGRGMPNGAYIAAKHGVHG